MSKNIIELAGCTINMTSETKYKNERKIKKFPPFKFTKLFQKASYSCYEIIVEKVIDLLKICIFN